VSATLRHGSNLGPDSLEYYQGINSASSIPLAVELRTQAGNYVEHIEVFAYVTPRSMAPEALELPLDDIRADLGRPMLWPKELPNREFEFVYEREGLNPRVEPICYVRRRSGGEHFYYELCDEFRLFADAFFHSSTGQYTSVDIRDAHEEVVARVDPGGIWVISGALKRYLGAKESVLVLDFCIEMTRLGCDVGRDPASRSVARQVKNDSFVCTSRELLASDETDGPVWILRRGRALVTGLPRERCCNGPIGKEVTRRFAEFAIGLAGDGSEITCTCDPIELDHGLQVAPEVKTDYYTPAYFSREVLRRYYDSPSVFEIKPDEVACVNWTLPCFTGLTDCVVVPLGNLGLYLPYYEQVRWRAFNCAALGAGREIEFDSYRTWSCRGYSRKTPEFTFKSVYQNASGAWEPHFGWSILLELKGEDSGLLMSLHTPFTDDQAEFDVQVIKLEKLLCDSLNGQELVRHTPVDDQATKDGSINQLEAFLASQTSDENWSEHVRFLRDLRRLRDCAGHMKGENYRKAAKRWRLDTRERPEVFDELLMRATLWLEYMWKLCS